MKLLSFSEHFPDELSCRHHLKRQREQEGILCKNCQHTSHYWCASKWMWQCKKCRFRTTLKSGTIMQDSKLPISYWYVGMHLMTATKKGISAVELQNQLGHKRYQPIWELMQKIRKAMGVCDDRYQLNSGIEMDEGFFKQVLLDPEKKEEIVENGLKRGGWESKTRPSISDGRGRRGRNPQPQKV